MPIAFQFDEENRILFAQMRGAVTVEAFQSFLEELEAEAQIPFDVDTIWDLRDFAFGEVSYALVERIVHERSRFPERARARLAIVVGDDLGYGISRIFEGLSSGKAAQIGIFREEGPALTWLQDAGKAREGS